MELYKRITLSNWQAIQERFSTLMPPVTSERIRGFDSSSEENAWLALQVLADLEQFTGKQHTLTTVMLFGQVAGNVQHEHVDGHVTDRRNDKSWALNIPIANCEQGEMFWNNGTYTLDPSINPSGLDYLEINWKEKNFQGSALIDSPTIVRVDIPHYVINHSDKQRLMLSLRFSPDLYDTVIAE